MEEIITGEIVLQISKKKKNLKSYIVELVGLKTVIKLSKNYSKVYCFNDFWEACYIKNNFNTLSNGFSTTAYFSEILETIFSVLIMCLSPVILSIFVSFISFLSLSTCIRYQHLPHQLYEI